MSEFRKAARRALAWTFKATVAVYLVSIATVLLMRWIDPPFSSFMVRKTAAAVWENDPRFDFRHEWVDWDAISPNAKLAVMASEDQSFPEHFGFDFDAMAEAWEHNREGGKIRGGSTISQQVAKNLFLWPGRSYVRKGLEAYFTSLIELTWPKQRILEVYLNVAEFGPGIFGVEAASRAYFKKPASRLTAQEAALLAAVLPNPARLRADRPSRYVLARRNWILRQMSRLGGAEYLGRIS